MDRVWASLISSFAPLGCSGHVTDATMHKILINPIIIRSSSYHHTIIILSSSYHHPIIILSSPYHHPIIILSSPCFISGKSIFSVITSFCHVPSLHHLLWKIYICLLLCPSPALLSLHDLVLNESFSAILLTCPIPALLTLLVLQQSLRAVGFTERWSSGFGIGDAARMWWCG